MESDPGITGEARSERAVERAGRVEETAGRPGVRVPVVGDPAALGVDPESFVAVSLGGHSLEVREEDCLALCIGQAVGPPHDHRSGAHHAIGDPALLVLEMPRGDPLRGAEQAALRRLGHWEAPG